MTPSEHEIPLEVLIRYFRVPTGDLPVDYPGRELLLGSRITNISVSGVFIRTQRPLPEGTELVIEFHLPEFRHLIRVPCVVRWRATAFGAEHVGSDSSGMGLEFKELARKEQKAIERFVRAFLERMRKAEGK